MTAQAASGDELLKAVAADPPEAVVLDLRMPPTFTDEGLAVAEQLRSRHATLGILVLSTYADASYAARLMRSGGRCTGLPPQGARRGQ